MTIGMKTVSFKTIIASAAIALGLLSAAAPAMAAGAAAHPRSGVRPLGSCQRSAGSFMKSSSGVWVRWLV